jgi:two-component system OmpR family response regulator
MSSEILLVEDDPVLGRGLVVNLEAEGYQVHWYKDLKSAGLARPTIRASLIVLDLNLPDGNGLSLLKTIRAEGVATPVIILTAQTDEDSVVEGLQSGANDYVRKPFGNKEFLARVKTAMRDPAQTTPQLRYGELVVLSDKRKVLYGDKEVDLNRREFDILCYFIAHAEAVVTREALLQMLDKDREIFDRTIDSHVSHVRSRLKQAGIVAVHITSVYGVGYRLEKS